MKWSPREGKTVREYLEVLNELNITGQYKQLFIFGTKKRERKGKQNKTKKSPSSPWPEGDIVGDDRRNADL